MQRLVLASEHFDRLPALLGEDPADLPVEFVPTAADVLDDRAYVEEERGRLVEMGFPVRCLSLVDAPAQQVAERLMQARLVFVTGGNVFHLLERAITSGFAEVVPRLVRQGSLIYVGVSAGAILAGPDLLPAASSRTRSKAPHLATTTALGLVPFSVLVHYGQPNRAARHQHVLAQTQPHPLVPLSDDQVVVVRGPQWTIEPAT